MKKMLNCFVILVLLFALTISVSAGEMTTLEKISERGKIIVGTAPGYFPFEMIDDNGEVMGFDIDMAEAIASELGVDLEIKSFQWSGVIPALQTGKVDMLIAGMTITPGRALKVTFSDPYFDTGLAMLVNNNVEGITSWEELDNEDSKIGVCLGQTSDFYAESYFQNAEIAKYQGSENLALAVMSGKVDAGIHDEPWVLIAAQKNKDKTYAVTEVHAKQSLGMTLPHNDLEFKVWIDSFLTYYKQRPEYQESYNYWFVDMPWMDE